MPSPSSRPFHSGLVVSRHCYLAFPQNTCIYFLYHGVTDRHLMRAACPLFFFISTSIIRPCAASRLNPNNLRMHYKWHYSAHTTWINEGLKAKLLSSHLRKCWCCRKCCCPALQIEEKEAKWIHVTCSGCPMAGSRWRNKSLHPAAVIVPLN